MPATAKLALPYPVATDTADVPRDIKALADRLDIVGGGAAVGALPGSPADGQEAYYVADAVNGVVWHLRYRAASASAYKWEVVGAGALAAEVAALSTLTFATAYTDLPTNNVSLTVPLAGEYRLDFGAFLQLPANANAAIWLALAPIASNNDALLIANPINNGNSASVSRSLTRRVLAAGAVVKMQYHSDTPNAGTAERKFIVATPLRVG